VQHNMVTVLGTVIRSHRRTVEWR